MQDLNIALLKTFVTVVDTGSLTAAGRRVGRTQPAITHQLRRLEHAVGRRLLCAGRRRIVLTADGEVLLQYARTMLRLNEEALMRLSAPAIEGRVVLGTPDLYAANLLPEVLGIFARAFPAVEVELRCMRSVYLVEALNRGELDLALVTRQSAAQPGETVRREPLIWVAGPNERPETEPVLPLALLPEGSVYRQHGLAALGAAGRPWRVVAISESIAGLAAAIFAGLAVSVYPQCATSPGMRRLGEREGLPELPAVDLVLIHGAQQDQEKAASRLAAFIKRQLGSGKSSS